MAEMKAAIADVLDVVGYNYGDKRLAYVKDHEKYPNRIDVLYRIYKFRLNTR